MWRAWPLCWPVFRWRCLRMTFNRLCASGLNVVTRLPVPSAGEGEVSIAGGGREHVARPYSMPKARTAFAFGNLTAWDTALGWRYPNPRCRNCTAQNEWGRPPRTSTGGDRASHARRRTPLRCASQPAALFTGMDTGKFAGEMIPVRGSAKGGEPLLVNSDEPP